MVLKKSSEISANVKAQARQALTGHYGTVIAANLLYLVISFLIAEFAAGMAVGTGIVYLIMSFLMNGVTTALTGIFTMGLYFIYANLLFDQPASVQDLFHAFRENPQKAMTLALIFYLLDYVCMLPSTLYLGLNSGFVSYHQLLVYFLIFALGNLVSFIIQLYFLFTYFLLLDYPSMTVRELFARSRQMMRGRMGTLFYIEISFIPLYLVGLLTFGIGCLYVMAYRYETVTAYYRYSACNGTQQTSF